MITPPPGYHFDPFADARMGLSLFQMTPEDWLVRDSGSDPKGEDAQRLSAPASQSGGEAASPSPTPAASHPQEKR